MKKSALYTAIGMGLFGALSATASAAPKFSGGITVLGIFDNIDTTNTNLTDKTQPVKTSNENRPKMSSEVTFRLSGDYALSEDLTGQYSLGYNGNIDSGANISVGTTYLGLKHKDYGTVRAGRLWTPDYDIDKVNASYNWSTGNGPSFSYEYGQRSNNSLQYISPKFNEGKTQVKIHYAMNEGGEGKDNKNLGGTFTNFKDVATGETQEIKRDFVVGHILHEDKKFDTGIAYTQAGSDFNALRAMAVYKPNDKLSVGALVQTVNRKSNDNEIGALVSASYKPSKTLSVWTQASHTKNYHGYKDGVNTTAEIGAIKTLKDSDGQRMRVFAGLSYNDTTNFTYKDKVLTRNDKRGVGGNVGLSYSF